MIVLRPGSERGHTRIDWLDSRHTFSFGGYQDPRWIEFHGLRVINDDRVAPGGGFGTHAHRDMEIVTYVLEGALEHGDSLGTRSVIRPGEVQRMSAGTGIFHSEFNHSATEPVHFLQIWIMPDRRGLPPDYEQRPFAPDELRGKLRRILSRDGADGSVKLRADVEAYVTLLEAGERVTYSPRPGRHVWVHLARGSAELNGQRLEGGDGAAVSNEDTLELVGRERAEVLLFDLPSG